MNTARTAVVFASVILWGCMGVSDEGSRGWTPEGPPGWSRSKADIRRAEVSIEGDVRKGRTQADREHWTEGQVFGLCGHRSIDVGEAATGRFADIRTSTALK